MIKPQNLLPNLSPRQPLEDEYISETDGLIYCSKCHTPRPVSYTHLSAITFILYDFTECRLYSEANSLSDLRILQRIIKANTITAMRPGTNAVPRDPVEMCIRDSCKSLSFITGY